MNNKKYIIEIIIIFIIFLFLSGKIYQTKSLSNNKNNNIKIHPHINQLYYHINLIEKNFHIPIYIGWNSNLSNKYIMLIPDNIYIFGKKYNHSVKNLCEKYDYIIIYKILYKYQNTLWYKSLLSYLYINNKKIYLYIEEKNINKLSTILEKLNDIEIIVL